MGNLLKKIRKGVFILREFGITKFINKIKANLYSFIYSSKINNEYENYIKKLMILLNDKKFLDYVSKVEFNNLENLWEFVKNFEDSLITPIQIKEEFLELLKIFRSINPKIILEIGSYRGGTLFCFTKLAADNSTIISIDLPFWGNKKYHKYDYLIIQLFNCFKKDNQQLYLIRASSQDKNTVSYLEKLLQGRRIDFIFIDGDHSYEAVKKDFELYSKFINTNGVIAFHDIAPNYSDGTSVFWQELKNNKNKYGYKKYQEIIKDYNQEACGIGILWF